MVVLSQPTTAGENQSCNTTADDSTVEGGSLTLNETPIHLASSFWGTTVSARSQILPNEAELINATQTSLIVWPGAGAGDTYDPIDNTIYNSSTGDSEGAPPTSEADFVAWCKSIDCEAIFQVPGEIDDPTLAGEIVSYTEINLSFRPAYWEIGNEPQDWKHWDEPWSSWSVTNTTNNTVYAAEVSSYITVMQNANNRTAFKDRPLQIIGIPAAARDKTIRLWEWIRSIIAYDGPRISAVAFHEYPSAGQANGKSGVVPTLEYFYENVTNGGDNASSQYNENGAGLWARYENVTVAVRNATATFCPTTCGAIPIFVTEIGTALSHRPFGRTYSAYFAGALAMSAQLTEAMALNVTNADVFASVLDTGNSWLSLQGSPRPEYVAYSEVLNHLGSIAYNVTLSIPPEHFVLPSGRSGVDENTTVFGVATRAAGNPARSDLLVVNTMVQHAVCFRPELPDYTAGAPLEVWYWNGTVSNITYVNNKGPTLTNNVTAPPFPTAEYFSQGLPETWQVPAQSLVLFETFSAPAAPVTFTVSGLAAGTTWFLRTGVESGISATSSSNLTILAPLGTIDPVPQVTYLPAIANETRFLPLPTPSPVTVSAGGITVPVTYLRQWRVTFASTPDVNGSISPQVTWANASEPLEFTAHPAYGYAVSEWVDSQQLGNGVSVTEYHGGDATVNGTNYTDVLSVGKWTSVTNTAAGLPSTTVTPEGFVTEEAVFGTGYPIVFTEHGLPAGTPWGVTLRSSWTDIPTRHSYTLINQSGGETWVNQTFEGLPISEVANSSLASITDSITFVATNHTYGFFVANVSGYRQVPVGANVTVAGSRVTVLVNFTSDTPPGGQWPVAFEETGLPSGTPWNITLPVRGIDGSVRNASLGSDGATIVFDGSDSLINGSYGYTATTVDHEYRAHPISDGFDVIGAGTVVSVVFEPVLFQVNWEESGLGNRSWAVIVDGQRLNNSGAWTVDRVPNGTYVYSIPAAFSQNPDPRSGEFFVQGIGENISVNFTPEMFNVTFVAQDDPVGQVWAAQLGSQSCPESEGAIRCEVPNGTAWFNITPPVGFVAVPSHGVVDVQAAPVIVAVSFNSIHPPPDPPFWSLGLPAIGAAAAIGLVGWGTYVLAARRKRRRSGAKP